jgi:HlyD family secretion protein
MTIVVRENNSQSPPWKNVFGQWIVSLTIALIVTNSFSYITSLLRPHTATKNSESPPPQSTAALSAVSALGKLEPKGEITRLSAPASLEGTRISEVKVKQGDRVKKGQAIAILDSYERRLAAFNKAKADVEIAKARLATVKAGAKPGDIQAQQEKVSRLETQLQGEIATRKLAIARLEAELNNADVEAKRHQMLYDSGATSASTADERFLRAKTAREQLNQSKAELIYAIERLEIERNEAKATLNSLSEVRVVDVKRAEAELNSEIAAVRQAQADLDLTQIKAPIDGRVLKVRVRPGEVIGTQGIADLGQTEQMYAVAQVYETDIEKVRVGQKVLLTSNAFMGKLHGKVEKIGMQVDKQDAFDDNPLEQTDNKIIEVKISLDQASSKKVTNLSNLQVQTVILQSNSK